VLVGDVVLTVRGIALRGVAPSNVPGLIDGPFGTSVVLGLQVLRVQGLGVGGWGLGVGGLGSRFRVSSMGLWYVSK
jgi:hypothetical protein